MPPNTVKVDRSTGWGNPYIVGVDGVGSQEDAVEFFKLLIAENDGVNSDDGWPLCPPNSNVRPSDYVLSSENIRSSLKGKNLACWCKHGTPCHADVLLKIANE